MKYTYIAKASDNKHRWWLIDANGLTLGRMATKIASIISGKNNPLYTPHVDLGDFVVVINAKKIILSGKKKFEKIYYKHSGYIGGLKFTKAKDVLTKNPQNLIKFAVRGMLPKNKLSRRLFKKLKVYSGPNHPHKAQKVEVMNLT